MKKNWLIIILISIAIALCFQNYTPGTILSGWDTLHPEFNFGLALKREILGVFRSYQGLGAVAAHSDMADLPRIILLYLLSPFTPMSFLRYFYIFLTLVLGPIGMYCFLKRVVFSKIPKESTIPSFLGALFYLLNLGTMQQFVVPLEMFTTQYAILPWLFLFATEYFNTKTHQKKTLVLFAITTLFSAPMAYAATFWYVYLIAFTLYVSMLTINRILKKDFAIVKKSSTLILLTLLINSFWMLPNIYFVSTHASEVTQANINKLFSPQAFLYNKEFGNIVDISLLKSFLFDWNVYSGNNQFTQLLHQWIVHLKQPFVETSGFIFAGISLCGIIYGALKRNKILISLLPLLFLCLLFLFNDNSPSSTLYTFLEDKIPFFKEAFRFPQNKVLGIFTFLFAIYFATGQLLIANLIKVLIDAKLSRHSGDSDLSGDSRISQGDGRFWTSQNDGKWVTLKYGQTFIFAILLFYFMLPAFKGNFISPYMRIKIPEYYFEMFKWFDKEPQDGRIANLPIHSLWGWEYYEWNGVPMDIGTSSPASEADRRGQDKYPSFQGAGFLWFGIKQPVLVRDFDRWSPYNEQYYREMSYAIYSQNKEALKNVLEKYNIKYILLDKSIIAPQNSSKVLLHQETQTLLNQQDYIEKIKEFGNILIVYKVKSKTPNRAYLLEDKPNIAPSPKAPLSGAKAFYEDVAYKDYGNYINKKGNVYYPLANLIDKGGQILPNVLKLSFEGVVIRLPKDSISGLSLPSLLETQESIASDLLVEKNQNQLAISLHPLFPLRDLKDRPIPIVTKVNLPQTKDVILSINKSLSLDTISLYTKNDNTIAIYPKAPNEKIVFDLSTIRYSLEPCGDKRNQNASFGIEKIQNNTFYLFGKNTHLCMTIPLSNLILKELETSEALLNVAFNYKSNLPLKFCISKLINGACQESSDNPLSQNFVLQRDDLQDLGLQFQLDSTSTNSIEKAFYSNLNLSLTYPLHIETIPNDALKKSLEIFSQNPLIGSTLILPYSSDKQLNADITTLPKTDGSCPNGPFSNFPLVKKQILANNNNRFIRYESFDGVSCDHFSYQNLSQNEAYLVAITSRNVKGLPSTLCITNAVSRHCDIYTTLSLNKDFNTDIFLLPPQIKNENGFDVNIGNLGIKKSPSINDLKSIEIIPFPYKWLSQIVTMGDSSRQARTINDLLVLPQSFEKGWKAYRVKSSKLKVQSLINRTFPFFFGKELKEHVLVNSWANGWILNNSELITNNYKLVIVFLPQYLEYLGFLLLLGTFTYLTIQAMRYKA